MNRKEYIHLYNQRNKERINELRRLNYAKKREEHLKVRRLSYGKTRALEVKSRQKLKTEVLTYYSTNKYPVCAHCGLTDLDILTIDHINGKGNEHRRTIGNKSGADFYRWLKKNSYPKGFQVLCFNCNVKKQIMYLRELR